GHDLAVPELQVRRFHGLVPPAAGREYGQRGRERCAERPSAIHHLRPPVVEVSPRIPVTTYGNAHAAIVVVPYDRLSCPDRQEFRGARRGRAADSIRRPTAGGARTEAGRTHPRTARPRGSADYGAVGDARDRGRRSDASPSGVAYGRAGPGLSPDVRAR